MTAKKKNEKPSKSDNTVESEASSKLRFLWGTFCQSVLSDGSSRSIHDVWQSMRIVGQPQPGADPLAEIKMPKAAIFAMFERVDLNSREPIDCALRLTSKNGDVSPTNVEMHLNSDDSHMQVSINIIPLTFEIPTAIGRHVVTPNVDLVLDGQVVGNIGLRVLVENVAEISEELSGKLIDAN